MASEGRAGWAGTFDEFLGSDRPDLLYRLGEHTRGLMLRDADHAQVEAWRESAGALTGLHDLASGEQALESKVRWAEMAVGVAPDKRQRGGKRAEEFLTALQAPPKPSDPTPA